MSGEPGDRGGSRRDRLVQWQAGVLIPIVEVWMRSHSFRGCQAGLARLAETLPRPSSPPDIDRAQSLARMVDAGNRKYSIYPADCLTRSLVLQYVLLRRSIPGRLVLGVRTLTGRFEAHAWVEYQDTPLNEMDDVRRIYTPLDWTAERGGSRWQ